MKKDVLFTVPSYFRDDMNIMAYRFGKGEKSCAVVGALRGDEVQQLYVCARLVAYLRDVEKDGGVLPGKSVMVIPTAIGASMNVNMRLWAPENMDITLSVIPNANASAINLDDTTGAIAPGVGSGLHIGDYSYTTTKESSDNSVRYYAFVSSEELPTRQGDRFLLKRRGVTDGVYDETNSIGYEIQLASNQVSGRPGSAFSGWFDGTASLVGIEEGDMSGVFFDSVFMEMYPISRGLSAESKWSYTLLQSITMIRL